MTQDEIGATLWGEVVISCEASKRLHRKLRIGSGKRSGEEMMCGSRYTRGTEGRNGGDEEKDKDWERGEGQVRGREGAVRGEGGI